MTATLFISAAAFGAIGMADGPRRPLWAFLATAFAALATAVAAYESTFGFRRLAREYSATVTSLQKLAADGPTPEDVDDEQLVTFVTEVETVFRYGR